MRPSWAFEIEQLPAEQNLSQCHIEQENHLAKPCLNALPTKPWDIRQWLFLGHYIGQGAATWYRLLKQFGKPNYPQYFYILKNYYLSKKNYFLGKYVVWLSDIYMLGHVKKSLKENPNMLMSMWWVHISGTFVHFQYSHFNITWRSRKAENSKSRFWSYFCNLLAMRLLSHLTFLSHSFVICKVWLQYFVLT